MKLSFLFLGTGASAGIPAIGCSCPVCCSSSPYNNRFRTSGLISVQGKHFLIDAGPDFRAQALKYQITRLDGVLITHSHFDHIAGLDELRSFYFLHRKPTPLLCSQTTFEDLRRRYDYMFETKNPVKSLSAQLQFKLLEDFRGETTFQEIPISYMTYSQSGMQVTGFRFGNFAYLTDIREYPETIFEDLKGVEILVLSALRYKPTAMQFSVDEAIAFARKAGIRKTYLTHISHDLEHKEASQKLPEGFALGYDGLKLEIS